MRTSPAQELHGGAQGGEVVRGPAGRSSTIITHLIKTYIHDVDLWFMI
jgi:hypothetical protein